MPDRHRDAFGIDMIRYCRDHERYLEARLSAGADPAELFAHADRPLGFVIGEREPFVRPEAFAGLTGAAVWQGGVQIIPAAGHAPFLEAPGSFNSLLLAFLRHVARVRPRAV